MVGKFAFSFDRDTFHGHERTRQDALAAAERKLNGLEFIPEAIFVGKRVPTDPGTSGLAETVLKLMRRRMNESCASTSISSPSWMMRWTASSAPGWPSMIWSRGIRR
jgi:hypothetical protein